MKYQGGKTLVNSLFVAPRTGGRGLKSSLPSTPGLTYTVAPRTGGRGLKSDSGIPRVNQLSRPPHRGAWIEIPSCTKFSRVREVAPRTGGRGLKSSSNKIYQVRYRVAPRTGGRGLKSLMSSLFRVWWGRPPHRGAWIEIATCLRAGLRKMSPPAQGGVD